MKARSITRLALLTAMALVLGYIEHLLPITGVPGVKLGLANTVLLYAVFLLDAKSAVLLAALKVLLSGLLFGGVSAMLYSAAGGAVSLAVMLAAHRLKDVSPVGVSVLGAIGHNAGQTAVGCLTVGARAMLAYAPVLLLAAIATGLVTGVTAKYVMRALSRGDTGDRGKK